MNGFCVLLSLMVCLDDQGAPATAPASTAVSAAPAIDPRIEAILNEMESTGANVEAIRCKVRYIVDSQINIGDRSERDGEVIYQTARPHPRFLITFMREKQGMGDEAIILPEKVWYLLQDRRLAIAKEQSKTVQRVQVAKPGEEVDFFDINKAPFPFPFGQKKRPMLEQFDITLVKPAKDEQHVDHLVCIPKPGAPVGDQWEKLDYYVLKDLRLPQRIVAVEKAGDKVITTIFPDLSSESLKAKLTDKDFEPPGDWQGYDTVVEGLDGAPLDAAK